MILPGWIDVDHILSIPGLSDADTRLTTAQGLLDTAFPTGAFEVAAIDYLVKPFDDERFEQAFRRARHMIELEEVGRTTRKLLSLLGGRSDDAGARPVAALAGGYLERVAVEMRGQVRVVPVESIDYIEASGPYAELHVGDKTYVIRERMQTLEERLDPAHFFRIHRSAIVRVELVETFFRGAGCSYCAGTGYRDRIGVYEQQTAPLVGGPRWRRLYGRILHTIDGAVPPPASVGAAV